MNKILIAASIFFQNGLTYGNIKNYHFIGEGKDDQSFYSATNRVKKVKLTSKNEPNFIKLNHLSTNMIDIRAFGDSGWSWTHESPAMAADFGNALDDFSPSGEVYRGDINFINWETTVGYTCDQWHAPYERGRSYAFLARPENVAQAIERGIEVFALSNNHTRDCALNTDTGLNGQLSTIKYLNEVKEEYPNLVFHGISAQNKNDISIIKRKIKGHEITIAFASYYTGRESCPHSVCAEDAMEMLNNFKKTSADLKILMIHTMSNQDKLVEVASKFINESDGDIVFGSGPHRWKPIRYIQKKNGHGIIFDSLGNFLHPSMASQSKNIISRILFDPVQKQIIQVQAISVRNQEDKIMPSEISPILIDSELEFFPTEVINDGSTFKTMYFNF